MYTASWVDRVLLVLRRLIGASFSRRCLCLRLRQDEWMDVETSIVVRKVQQQIQRLVDRTGAVVLSVTHKPQLYGSIPEEKNDDSSRQTMSRPMTLCRGSILPTGMLKSPVE